MRKLIISVNTKLLHWLLCRIVEVCSQGCTMEHDHDPPKSLIPDCLELIRSPGAFWQTFCHWIYFLVKDH